MTTFAELPLWASAVVSVLLVTGSVVTLIGSLGLITLKTFYERVHAPTLGTTLGMASILAASIVCFSVLESRPVVHEILIAVFVTVTTPVTLIWLVRATVSRPDSPTNRI